MSTLKQKVTKTANSLICCHSSGPKKTATTDPKTTTTTTPATTNTAQTKTTTPPLNVTIYNHFAGRTLYAYVTATDLNGNKLFLVQADGKTLYYPDSPASQSPLAQNCSIPITGAGTNLSIPVNFGGGRIWFCLDQELTFAVNPGPGLVEPSAINPADPNSQKHWAFAELTFDPQQVFVNISYVDFIAFPIALRLVNTAGAQQNVLGIPDNGLTQVADQLQAQHNADGAGWDQLIVKDSSGALLRVLSPSAAISTNASLFSGYFDNYVNQVWSAYTSAPLTINTQTSFGNVQGQVQNDKIVFADDAQFAKPNAIDIFGCNSGPFSPGQSDRAMTIVPRLSAGFNRTCLLESNQQPNGVAINQFYPAGQPTNYYSKILHSVNLDNKGYAFPYDDVKADNGADVSGAVNDPNPQTLFITVGGGTNAAPA